MSSSYIVQWVWVQNKYTCCSGLLYLSWKPIPAFLESPFKQMCQHALCRFFYEQNNGLHYKLSVLPDAAPLSRIVWHLVGQLNGENGNLEELGVVQVGVFMCVYWCMHVLVFRLSNKVSEAMGFLCEDKLWQALTGPVGLCYRADCWQIHGNKKGVP